MSNTESENIQLMGAALIVLSLALLYCWYQSDSDCDNKKQYFNVPRVGYQRQLEGFKQNNVGNQLHDMTNNRIIQPFTSNEYKSKANFTSMRRAVDGGITFNAHASESPVSSPMFMDLPSMPLSAKFAPFVSSAPTMSSAGAQSANNSALVAPVVSSSSDGANMLARKTSALKNNLKTRHSPFDDTTVTRNLNVADVQNTHLNDMVNGMTNRQTSTLECPLSTTAMVMSMSEFTPQYSENREYYPLTM